MSKSIKIVIDPQHHLQLVWLLENGSNNTTDCQCASSFDVSYTFNGLFGLLSTTGHWFHSPFSSRCIGDNNNEWQQVFALSFLWILCSISVIHHVAVRWLHAQHIQTQSLQPKINRLCFALSVGYLCCMFDVPNFDVDINCLSLFWCNYARIFVCDILHLPFNWQTVDLSICNWGCTWRKLENTAGTNRTNTGTTQIYIYMPLVDEILGLSLLIHVSWYVVQCAVEYYIWRGNIET